jgi:hypothetical protein
MPRRVSHPHLLSLCGSNAAVLHGRAAAQQHVAALGAAGCLTAGAPHLLLGCYGQHCQHCLGHGWPGAGAAGRRSAGGGGNGSPLCFLLYSADSVQQGNSSLRRSRSNTAVVR